MRSKPPDIPEEEVPTLAELADDLFTHLLETNALSDPSEAQIIAAAFMVEQYEKGWRFKKEDDEREKGATED